MTITVAQAVLRCRRLLDDRDDNPLVSDADLKDSLIVAADEVWQTCVRSGANIYTQFADITSGSNGIADLASIKPLKIVNVSVVSGGALLTVPAARIGAGMVPLTTPQNLRIAYVPRMSFPTNDGDNIVWGADANICNTLDQLLCLVAAADAWIVTGEPFPKPLTTRKEELNKSILEQINVPQYFVFDGNGRPDVGFVWSNASLDKLQLIY